MKKKSVGIIVGRFQVPELSLGHRSLIIHLSCARHDANAVFLGTPLYPNRNDPLSFEYRAHQVRAKFTPFDGPLTIFNIIDERDDQVWSEKFDSMVREQYPGYDVVLYGGRDCFINRYSGVYKNFVQIDPSEGPSGTDIRTSIVPNNLPDFGKGVAYALNQQYPHVRPTVDIAVFDTNSNAGKMVVIFKDSDHGMCRLPGGHVDLADESYKFAALRELKEETGIDLAYKDLTTVDSFKISDWRFKDKNKEGIMTTLFLATVNRHLYTLAAGDDADDIGWMSVEDVLKIIVPEHEQMVQLLFGDLVAKKI